MQKLLSKLFQRKNGTDVFDKPIKVLFADDNAETLRLSELMANQRGWKGTYVTSAIGIIEMVNKNCVNDECYDCIVADVNFSNEVIKDGVRHTGITAARAVRKADLSIPIVFITGYSSSLIREEVRRVQGEIFSKPIDINLIFERVEQLIYWHRLAVNKNYDGHDRRRSSVNRSSYKRRASDQMITIPKILSDIMRNVKESKM